MTKTRKRLTRQKNEPQRIAIRLADDPLCSLLSESFALAPQHHPHRIYSLSELQGRSPDEIVRSLPHLTLAQVHAALAYYFDHREDVLNEIREDQTLVGKIRDAAGPGPLEAKLKSKPATLPTAVRSGNRLRP